jgi:hypothetical protein
VCKGVGFPCVKGNWFPCVKGNWFPMCERTQCQFRMINQKRLNKK